LSEKEAPSGLACGGALWAPEIAKEKGMKIFDARDVIQFAVRIEEDGEAFYRKAALAAQDKDTRDLFSFLADEEIQHKTLFREMFSKMEVLQPPETYDGEYAAYLSDFIDGKVIFRQGLVPDTKDTSSAITFAMQREADSILYYHEAKRFIAEKYYSIIEKIITEERKHFSKLSELRKKHA
jgi:rubrerythrin